MSRRFSVAFVTSVVTSVNTFVRKVGDQKVKHFIRHVQVILVFGVIYMVLSYGMGVHLSLKPGPCLAAVV